MDGGGVSKKRITSSKSDRTPIIFKEFIEKCRTNNIDTHIIPGILNQKPKIGQAWSTYFIDKTSLSLNSVDNTKDIIKMYIAFPNNEKSGTPQKIFFKGTKISSNFLNILCSVLPKYDQITTIKLLDCNLSKLAIETLHSNLKIMPNINIIYLDGNPISAQNHGILACSDSLIHLSLQRCKINEVGLEILFENLNEVENSKLQVLNLTGNNINDAAAVYIGKILRDNRSINALILADNWITDVGCQYIMTALQNFTLTKDEVAKRRSINLNYFKTKLKLAEDFKKDKIVPVKPVKANSASSTPKSKKLAKSRKQKGRQKNIVAVEINKQASEFIENTLPKITHPFICDTKTFQGNLICKGNFNLSFINLAYNKLTLKSYLYIVEVLTYQLSPLQTFSGLVYVVLNGNADLLSPEFEEVDRLVQDKLSKLNSRSSGSLMISDATSGRHHSSFAS